MRKSPIARGLLILFFAAQLATPFAIRRWQADGAGPARAEAAPGWIISATKADGIARVYNHGTDHSQPGDRRGDSGLYARIGYSTATAPWLDDASWASPPEQSAALVDATGRATHRNGFATLGVRIDRTAGIEVGVAASRATAHWLAPDTEQWGHGYGWTGQAIDAGTLTVVSLVRGPWEVRLVHVDALADGVAAQDIKLRMSGWPTVDGDGLNSTVRPLTPPLATGSQERTDASILGDPSVVPWADFPVEPGTWSMALIDLQRRIDPAGGSASAILLSSPVPAVAVTWPDGATTTTELP